MEKPGLIKKKYLFNSGKNVTEEVLKEVIDHDEDDNDKKKIKI